MRVYIAGPYSKGNVNRNITTAIREGNRVLEAGHWPYIPHLNHLWDLVCPQSYETWLALDMEWLALCDALIRLPGESPGADREVQFALERRMPVYHGVDDFLFKVGLACRQDSSL